jgi:thioredoxin reductase
VIVGGGLAGLAAAVEARRAGFETCLIEQHQQPRGPRRLVAEFAASGAETLLESAVWGIWGHDLAVCEPKAQSSLVTFEQLIVATGSVERPVAFPGWRLPGVVTLDSAVRLLEQGAPLGQRVVVAGYGALSESAASALARFGITPVAMLDAAARSGRLPLRAEGTDHIECLFTVRVDANWRPRPGMEQRLEVDTLVLAFGALPEDRLARLAGCHYSGSPFVDPWTTRDAWMHTSMAGVLVAGDAGGIVGADAAIDQGRLAGLAAALDAGCLNSDQAERRARPIQRRLARVTRLETPPDCLFTLAQSDTPICRCEGVTREMLEERLWEASLEPAGVIAETRATMGVCQGRECATLVAATIACHAGVPLERIPPITPRPPIVPVPLGAIAERPPVFPPLAQRSAAG